ncbi:sodium:solute symporter family protein [Sedimentisphaera salicampi]|uniref:sodium:solute symporter family protein n=1 Tax=Sedimentisphaera salicampi TaxID=1941349 RepID=UPI000B9A49AE|nr:sodium:solute symporter family protein [Sedimentisphaera salicampi]OXU15313.1 Na(+)/glucose symporter [Sedimentisphaera salicampi]
MNLSLIDILIIALYLVIIIVGGFLLSRKASKNIQGYFLSGKTVPWYLLGLSCASSSFDIAGTMWFVYIIFVYGMKGAWLPWMWPTFITIFHMVFLAKWMRRSGVMTGAEWLKTRFGDDRGSQLSQLSIVIFAIIASIGFLSYAFVGIGKFAATFLPWELSPNAYAVILMLITATYVVAGGMFSVVLTDILQWFFLTISSVVIAVIAWIKVSPEKLKSMVPEGWGDLFFGLHLNLDWSEHIASVNESIASDGWSLFSVVIMMMVFKGILISLAGVAPNFDMQRILACKSPRESSLMNFLISIALAPRWLMIGGIAVLGIVYYSPDMNSGGAEMDFENILPYVMNNFLPAGLLGILLAGLISAFMSTFDSTVNAGAAYIVNDLYKKYFKPKASDKEYVLASYAASFLLVAAGIFFGLMAKDINQAMQWIVSGLYAGYAGPNILKWYWWRFNGIGYFWGMISGIAAALFMPKLYQIAAWIMPEVLSGEFSPLYGFPFIVLISITVSIAASLLTKPEDEEVLKRFYKSVRPWGFWKPVYEKVRQEDPAVEANRDFFRDMVNVFIGTVWQLMLITLPLYMVIQNWTGALISCIILAGTSVFLKFNWYDHLEKESKYFDSQIPTVKELIEKE